MNRLARLAPTWGSVIAGLLLAAAVAVAQPSAPTTTFRYDANGNLVGKSEGGVEWTYVYDVRDRLVEVRRDGLTVESYRYDHQDRRISTTDASGTTTRFLWDGDRLVAERDATGATIATYTHAGERPLSMENADEGRNAFQLDGLGSPVSLSRPDGSLSVRYRYDAFGATEERAGDSPNPIGFTGHLFDGTTGLYYARARYYDPEIGRFLTTDPFEGTPDEPRSLHPYLYAYANPTAYVDLDGRCVGSWQQSGFCQAISRAIEHFYAGDPLGVADRDVAIHGLVMDGRSRFREEFGREPHPDEIVATVGSTQLTAGFEEIDTSGRIEADHLEWSLAGVGVGGRAAYSAARAGGASAALAAASGAREAAVEAGTEFLGADPRLLGTAHQALRRRLSSEPPPLSSQHGGAVILTEATDQPGVASEALAERVSTSPTVTDHQIGARPPRNEQPRDDLGRFRCKENCAQRLPGASAVDDFIERARAQGFDLMGREVTVNTPFGQRRYDVVLMDRNTGYVSAFEIKSSPSAFDRFDKPARQQFAADRWVNQHGAVAVGRYEGLQIDSTTKVLWEPP